MKERETGSRQVEEQATREVDAYVERMKEVEGKDEKKEEERKDDVSAEKVKLRDDGMKQVSGGQGDGSGKIILPLDKEEMGKGSKVGVNRAMRWLVETCVYLIKKYPGRVFYKKKIEKENG